MSMVRQRAFMAPVAVLCFAVAAFGQGTDVVKINKNGEIKDQTELTVSQDDIKGVKAKKGPATLNFPAAEVVAVVYGRQPEAFKAGMKAFGDSNFEEAIKNFADAASDEDDKKTFSWLANYCAWYTAQSYELMGDAQKAVDSYNELVAKHATSRFVPDALSALGNLYLAAGKADQAKGFFDKLADLAKKDSLGDRATLKAELGVARVGVAKGEGAAVTTLEQIAARAGAAQPEVAAEANLEIGRFHVKKKDYAKAESVFQKLLSSPGATPRAWAGAANGMADVQFDQAKYLDAAFSYSKVFTLMLDERGDPAIEEAIGWALYRGGKAADLHRGTLADADPLKTTWGRRGRFLMQQAAIKFKTTRGGAEARKELGLN
jgi:tetratricopeptide (TPR) repeat protein